MLSLVRVWSYTIGWKHSWRLRGMPGVDLLGETQSESVEKFSICRVQIALVWEIWSWVFYVVFFFFNLQESAQILSVHLMSFDNCEHPYNHHCKQDVECFHHSGKSSCVLVHPVFSCPRDNHCSNFHHHRLSLQVLGLHRNALKQYFLLFFPLDFFTQQNVLEIGPCCVYQ